LSPRKANPEPVWNVFLEDFNRKEIRTFNVFHNYTFDEQLKKEFKKYTRHKDLEKLKAEIKSWAMYCFWSKCEYEIILTSFPEKKGFKEKKVDVYQQLMLNWDSFVEYVINNKAYFLRRESKKM